MLTERARPSIAFFDKRISISKIGRITGKLSIAISDAPALALEAIPEISVKVPEKPTAPKNKAKKKNGISKTGLPSTIL